MARTLGYKCLKLVHGFSWSILPTESADTRWTYINHHPNDVYSGGSETEMSPRFWIHMIIHRNSLLAAKKDCMNLMYNCWAPNDWNYDSKVSSNMSVNRASTVYSPTYSAIKQLHSRIHPNKKSWKSQWVKWPATRSLPHHKNEHQRRIKDFWSCMLDNHWAVQWHLATIIILAAFMGNDATD